MLHFSESSLVLAQCNEQKLIASAVAEEDLFGGSISISGDVAVVGARGTDCANGINCGAAYVFRYNGINRVEEQELTAPDATEQHLYGTSVSVSGNVIVVGESLDDDRGTSSGSVFVYRYDSMTKVWVQEAKLGIGGAFTTFGGVVSISGDVLLVGQGKHPPSTQNAYVFRYDPSEELWNLDATLSASDTVANDWFGYDLSISGNVILVGAIQAQCEDGSQPCGSAYVYRYNGTWQEEQKLSPPDSRQFGSSVSVHGDMLVVGEPGEGFSVCFPV